MWRLIRITNILSLLCVMFMSYIAATSNDIQKINNSIDFLFKPASYAYSIWYFIYFMLLVWAILGIFSKAKENDVYDKVGIWFCVHIMFEALWIIVFTKGYIVVSYFMMLLLWVSLCIVFRIVKQEYPNFMFSNILFSIYFSWISFAGLINFSLLLAYLDVEEFFIFGELAITIAIIYFSYVVTKILSEAYYNDYFFVFVSIWGMIAIAVEHKEEPYLLLATICFCIIILVNKWQISKQVSL